MDLKTKIKNRDDFSLKFADAPFDINNILNPGWAEPTYDDFFKRMVDEPVLLNQSTVLPMTALQHDLDMLTADVELDSQRDSTGNSAKLTQNELSPNMDRKQLIAQPLQAKTVISDNFLEENIEGEDFLSNYMNLLADNMGPAFEMWGLYANTTATPVSGEGTGYNMTNGVLAQLQTVAADANNESKGIADLVYGNNVGEGILNAVQQYVEQDGNISNARIVLPPAVHSKFMLEIAKNKDTAAQGAVTTFGFVSGDRTVHHNGIARIIDAAAHGRTGRCTCRIAADGTASHCKCSGIVHAAAGGLSAGSFAALRRIAADGTASHCKCSGIIHAAAISCAAVSLRTVAADRTACHRKGAFIADTTAAVSITSCCDYRIAADFTAHHGKHGIFTDQDSRALGCTIESYAIVSARHLHVAHNDRNRRAHGKRRHCR